MARERPNPRPPPAAAPPRAPQLQAETAGGAASRSTGDAGPGSPHRVAAKREGVRGRPEQALRVAAGGREPPVRRWLRPRTTARTPSPLRAPAPRQAPSDLRDPRATSGPRPGRLGPAASRRVACRHTDPPPRFRDGRAGPREPGFQDDEPDPEAPAGRLRARTARPAAPSLALPTAARPSLPQLTSFRGRRVGLASQNPDFSGKLQDESDPFSAA